MMAVAAMGLETYATTACKIEFTMANLNELSVNQVMRALTQFAPPSLIICALLSFGVTGMFLVDYYETLFVVKFSAEKAIRMAIVCAVVQELIRFCLLLASARDFSESKPFNGWLGLMVSFYLVYHDIRLAHEIAVMWNPESPLSYSTFLIFFIIMGLALEMRLVLTIGSLSKAAKKSQEVVPASATANEFDNTSKSPKKRRKRRKKKSAKKSSNSIPLAASVNGVSSQ